MPDQAETLPKLDGEFTEAVQKAMSRGSNNVAQDKTISSRSPFDRDTIMNLVQSARIGSVQSYDKSVSITPDFTNICWTLTLGSRAGTRSPAAGQSTASSSAAVSAMAVPMASPQPVANPKIYIDVLVHKGYDTAHDAMRSFLATFDGALDSTARRALGQYGEYSLENEYTVFWVFYRHFVKISTDDENVGRLQSTLRPLAVSINQFLWMNKTGGNLVPYPQPFTKPIAPITVQAETTFKVKADNVTDIDPSMRSVVGKEGLVVQMKPASSAGEFVFLAQDKGNTTVSLLFTHAKFFTLAEFQFEVSVV
ncbi:hypothetical protein BJ170DRAFT_364566 [Xylariales sp. AK1849]|nr:hypothetical protein BJ170DRAFT_364566 [Xylariales sp. AK1849]